MSVNRMTSRWYPVVMIHQHGKVKKNSDLEGQEFDSRPCFQIGQLDQSILHGIGALAANMIGKISKKGIDLV